MNPIFLSLALILAIDSAHALSKSIVEVSPGITVEFPGQPERSIEPNTRSDMYSLHGDEAGDTFVLVATTVTASAALNQADARRALEEFTRSHSGRGAVVSSEILSIQSCPAARVEALVEGTQRTRALALVKGATFITLQWATVAETALPDSLGAEFFDSLRMDDECTNDHAMDLHE